MSGRYPIIDRNSPGRPDDRRRVAAGDTQPPVRSVPWSLVEPLRERCMSVLGQTLERLAERGGLGLEELWAHLHWDGQSRSDFWKALEHGKTPDELRAWLRGIGGEQ